MSLKDSFQAEVKSALREKNTLKVNALRMLLAAIKQQEVDKRVTLSDADILPIIEKLIKQRRESIKSYEAGNRPELAEKEQQEIDILKAFLPEPLPQADVMKIIEATMATTGASSMRDMGKVMAILKEKLANRADMAKVSAIVKTRLQ